MTKEDSTPKLSDEPVGGGLYLSGRGKRKSYVWRGRVNGRPARKVLRHPVTDAKANTENMTLTEARKIAKAMTADALNGGVTHFAHIEAKPKPGDFTVAQAWADYMEREGKHLKPRTVENKVSQFRRFIEPRWGTTPVRAISTKDCKALLGEVRREFEAKGLVGAQVNVLHSNLSQFFRFCAKRDEYRVESNPMLPLDERPIDESLTRKGARALSEEELRWFFRAAAYVADAPRPGQPRRRAVEATELLLRTATRRNEIYTARWGWLRDDGLMIPPEVAKNGCAILIPLDDVMLDLIGERPADAKDETLIFNMSLSWLCRAIEDIRPVMTRISGVSGDFALKGDPRHFGLHELARDTFMTRMGEVLNEEDMPRFPFEVREACLNHRPSGVGARHYDANASDPRWFFKQRRAALTYWRHWLDRLKAEALQEERLAA